MNKNIIKKLAKASYSGDKIDKTKAIKVSKSLNRSDLKVYIKNLKNIENRRIVVITLPSEKGASEIKQMFARIYPLKRIVLKIDPELITGIKVIDYDNEYEFSLKNFLEDSLNYITQND